MPVGYVAPGAREAAAERRVKALELRKAGASYRQIGRTLGVSEKTAHGDVHRALAHLAQLETETATALRTLELARLDALYTGHFSRAVAGDDKAARICIAIQERRARLLGLDAPVRTELTGKDGAPLAFCAEWGGEDRDRDPQP